MLEQALHLHHNIFSNTDMAATRDGYGDGLVELGEMFPNVVVLTADLKESTREEKFASLYPERFFEIGVAEQNMAAVASGMAVSGKIPFMSSYATFSPGKNWETIRTTIVYNKANVKIAGHHAGIMTAQDGATHQAMEDIAITRCLPDLQIIVPCDYHEAKKATMEAAKMYGAVYLRFTREKTPILTSEHTPFEIGKAYTYWEDKDAKVTIFATGHMLYYALLAAKQLKEEHSNVIVVNVPTIKPLDETHILRQVARTKAAVSVEDHQITGGLGGALAELFARNFPIPMESVGLLDTFAESGSPIDLLKKYHMDTDAIITAVKKVVARKNI